MLQNVQGFEYPSSLDEALSYLRNDDRSKFIAGGTGIALSGSKSPAILIDITRLNLSGIEGNEDSFFIGATTPLQDLIEYNRYLSPYEIFFEQGVREVSSYPLRNAGTIGGSLGRAFPWSDLITMLSVLDSTVLLYDGTTTAKKLTELYSADRRGHLQDSIITGVRVNRPHNCTEARFIKYNRSDFDVAVLNLAIRITSSDRNIDTARIAVGARPMLTARLTEVENLLEGENPGRDLAREAAKKASEVVEVAGDNKASADYRRIQLQERSDDLLCEIFDSIDVA